MTLRRARLCGNDAHGFTFAREISSSFNGRRRLTGHRRGLAFVAVANPPRFSVFRESAHPFKIPVAPLSAVVSCRNSPFGILSNVTRLASSGSLFTGRSRHNEWQKARGIRIRVAHAVFRFFRSDRHFATRPVTALLTSRRALGTSAANRNMCPLTAIMLALCAGAV